MDTRTIHAACSLDCPDSCGVLVTVQTGDDGSERAIKVQGDPAHPVTRGFLCGKVAKMLDLVYASDRLLYPMRRRPGIPKGPLIRGEERAAFERISWDEALAEIASRLGTIAAEFGPESVLPYSYAGTTGQLGYGSMDRRFFYRLGASQLDRTICASAGAEALVSVYGIKLGTVPQHFADAGLVIAWGANIHGNNIHLWPFIEQARRNGARLIVIDPYRTRTAALADQHLAINPGTDGLLALGMMHVIFREGLEDSDYIEACTHGGSELRAHALPAGARPCPRSRRDPAFPPRPSCSSPATTPPAPGAPASRPSSASTTVCSAARTAEPPPARLRCCPLITGSWTRRGGGLLLSTSGSFPFNSAKVQKPELMQASPLGRPSRTVNMNQLGAALEDGIESPIKALFVYNSNPASVAPNQNAVLRGLRRADLFTVVHDQVFTDTADYADILLPAPTFLETKDLQGAYGHLFVQISSQAIQPVGEARNNVDVFSELGRRMGFKEDCFNDTVDDLIDQALSTRHPWLAGVSRERLEREGHVALAMPEGLPFATPEWFRTPSGRGELVPVPVYIAPRESRENAPDEFPLEFLGRKADNFMNTTFASNAVHQKMESGTDGVLEMHPDDAEARGVAAGRCGRDLQSAGKPRSARQAERQGRPGSGRGKARLDQRGKRSLRRRSQRERPSPPRHSPTSAAARRSTRRWVEVRKADRRPGASL